MTSGGENTGEVDRSADTTRSCTKGKRRHVDKGGAHSPRFVVALGSPGSKNPRGHHMVKSWERKAQHLRLLAPPRTAALSEAGTWKSDHL